MKTEKQHHGGRRHACHDTYQGNKYSFSVRELGLRNMYTKYEHYISLSKLET